MRSKYRIKIHLILIAVLSLLGMSCARADVQQLFENYLWEKRIILVFAPDREHEFLKQQVNILDRNENGLKNRDIIRWVFINHDLVSVDGKHMPHLGTTPFYEAFKINPKEFAFILIGKDGEEKLRRNNVVEIEELFSIIDQMPIRQREMQNLQ